MKKYLIFAMFVVLVVVLASPFSVSAKTKAGAKPGSFFYFFDKAIEKTSLFFTFNPEKKAKKALENAEERLAEAEESASENNQEAVAEAMENYQKNIEVLEKVLVKVPEEAKEAIEKAIEASKERQEEAMEETAEIEKEVSEIKPEVEETENELKEEENEKDSEIKDGKKDEQSKEIEKLKKEVEGLKQKTSQIKVIEKVEKPVAVENKQSSSSQTKQKENIVTLPNGAVVEMDESGNVVRTIKEAPEQTYIPQITNNSTSLSVSVGDIKITSSSAHLEWKTNIPTDSKVFLNQPDGSIKVFSSASGNSTMHFVDITNLISSISYKYTIEAIAGMQNKKIDGSFTTNQQTFVAESVKSLTNQNDTAPFLKLSSDRPFTIKRLVFLDDGTYCSSGYPFAVLTLQYLSVGKDAKKEIVNSTRRFVFDFPDGLISFGITFRLTAGTESLQSSSCIYDGMKFILRDSESSIFGENGQQVEVPHLILMGK